MIGNSRILVAESMVGLLSPRLLHSPQLHQLILTITYVTYIVYPLVHPAVPLSIESIL